ncbi:MAG: hypothetical protein ACP6IS_10275 [Candidatus Asgardarchaeia archaeon]
MTGPAKGKVPIEVKVTLYNNHVWKVPVNAYIHVKGYSLARVTHLDLESDLFEFENKEQGYGAIIVGRHNGFVVVIKEPLIRGPHKYTRIEVKGLNIIERGKRVGGYLGLKEGGIFIGFKKEVLRKLEEIAKEKEPELFEDESSKLEF